jgi:hypothetical protein
MHLATSKVKHPVGRGIPHIDMEQLAEALHDLLSAPDITGGTQADADGMFSAGLRGKKR